MTQHALNKNATSGQWQVVVVDDDQARSMAARGYKFLFPGWRQAQAVAGRLNRKVKAARKDAGCCDRCWAHDLSACGNAGCDCHAIKDCPGCAFEEHVAADQSFDAGEFSGSFDYGESPAHKCGPEEER